MQADIPDFPHTSWPHRYGVLAAIWTVLVGWSLFWNLHLKSQNTLGVAAVAALSTINKDMSFRKWATSHGGVYVQPDQHTPPNPYLKLPDRDVLTTKGKSLTLMNPAYMLRQMQNDFPDEYGTRSHITSLKPLNPKNAPDTWERKALLGFEHGSKELMEVQQIDGQPYLRMMRPFIVEQGCMKCHEQQGYKVGDIRGGIGTAVPLEPYLTREREFSTSLVLSHATIWLIGIAGLGLSYRRDRHLSNERQKAANALRQLNEELETRVRDRTAQLEAANADLESFSYSVSHDLRAPLRAIDGFAAILREDYAPSLDNEGKRLFQVVSDNANKMAQLIDDILAFSRASRLEPQMEEIDMNTLAREVWQGLEPQQAGRTIEFHLLDLPMACGDLAAMRQVLQNLLSNAVKFTRGREPAVVELGCVASSTENAYYVRDNGAGFDMEYVGKLFGLFQRLHGMDEFEGTGVGLAIVKRFIVKHGGRVWAEGRPGEGATFWFALPPAGPCNEDIAIENRSKQPA
ncbi:MAG: ATP-binding protein [Sulfuricella sp.]